MYLNDKIIGDRKVLFMFKRKFNSKYNHDKLIRSLDLLNSSDVINFMKEKINSFTDMDKIELKNVVDNSFSNNFTIYSNGSKKYLKDIYDNIISRGYDDIQTFEYGYAIVVREVIEYKFIIKRIEPINRKIYYGIIDEEGNEILKPFLRNHEGINGLKYVKTEIELLREKNKFNYSDDGKIKNKNYVKNMK